MDVNENVDLFSRSSLVFLTFLQQSPLTPEVQQHLDSFLQRQLYDYTEESSLVESDVESDGHLEVDGHSPFTPIALLQDDFPQVHHGLPVNAEEARDIREVAAELIIIADRFDHIINLRAAERLTNTLKGSHKQFWHSHLSQSVDTLLREVQVDYSDRVVMAVTFSLFRRVCERAPQLLQGLYGVVMRYLSPS